MFRGWMKRELRGSSPPLFPLLPHPQWPADLPAPMESTLPFPPHSSLARPIARSPFACPLRWPLPGLSSPPPSLGLRLPSPSPPADFMRRFLYCCLGCSCCGACINGREQWREYLTSGWLRITVAGEPRQLPRPQRLALHWQDMLSALGVVETMP